MYMYFDLRLLLGTEASIMVPNGVHFFFLFFLFLSQGLRLHRTLIIRGSSDLFRPFMHLYNGFISLILTQSVLML